MRRIRVVAAVVETEGKLLICRRPSHKRHGGLWEFPGGKVEDGEDDLAALRRELREELGVEVTTVDTPVFEADDLGSAFSIVFVPTSIEGTPHPFEHDQILWARLEDLDKLPLAPTDQRYVEERTRSQHRPGN
jgi:8-oxo-dGTP diphosphatase